MSPSFQIKATNFSITYPQANNLSREQILNFYKKLSPKYVTVAKELHQDGNTHFHVAVGFGKRRLLADSAAWDIEGNHPNIQSTRDPLSWNTYCTKEDTEFLAWGETPKEKVTWKSVVLARDEQEFMDKAKECSPRDWVLQHDRIESYAKKKFHTIRQYISDPTWKYNPTPEIQSWMSQEFEKLVSNMSFIFLFRKEQHRFAQL